MRKRVSIIGSDEAIFDFVKQLLNSKSYQLVYITTKEVDINLLSDMDAVYIDESLNKKYKEDLLNFCIKNNKDLYIIPTYLEIACLYKYERFKDFLVYKACDFKLSKTELGLKRFFDIVFSLVIIIVLSPLMLAIYLMIKIFDGGKVIYCQERLTMGKKTFVLFKFRTMIENAENETGVTLSSENDERVTNIGRFLRKTRLDELPQIFNVLLGEMSIVGPRPERPYYVEIFDKENKNYSNRYHVKAGITGLAQINCRYNSTYENKLKFDLLYIARFSLWQDIIIILKTFNILFDKRASEGTKEDKLKLLLTKHKIKLIEVQPKLYELRNINEKNSYHL